MSYTEVLTGTAFGQTSQTANENWESTIHKEYIGELKMKFLMGSSPSSVLQVKEDLTKKAGDAISIRYSSAQEGGTVRGNAKGIGNEGKNNHYEQRFVVDNTRNLHKVWDVPMTQQRVNFDVLMDSKDALNTKHSELFDDDIVAGLTDVTFPTTPVDGRFLYGSTSSNFSGVHATDLAKVDATSDQLTSSIIGIAKRKALIKGTGISRRIMPTKIMNGLKQERWFMFMGHTYAIRDLVNNDAAFRNANLLLPPGNRSDHIFFTGSDFKGSWEGVLIYENDRMPLTASTIQTTHCLLMGAQSGAVVWGQRTKFGEEFEDLKHNVIYEYHDIRNKYGVGTSNNVKMVYNDGTNEHDHGMVNVFVSAVAD